MGRVTLVDPLSGWRVRLGKSNTGRPVSGWRMRLGKSNTGFPSVRMEDEVGEE